MFRIHKIIDGESLILKEEEPITLIEVGTGKERKLLLERESREKDTRAKVNTKQIIKEELKQAEYVKYGVIPLLRFKEIQKDLKVLMERIL